MVDRFPVHSCHGLSTITNYHTGNVIMKEIVDRNDSVYDSRVRLPYSSKPYRRVTGILYIQFQTVGIKKCI